MKKQVHVFNKSISLVLAICILFASCFTFQGCNGYEEDYSVLKEKQVPAVIESIKLQETGDLIVNLKKTINVGKKFKGDLKSAYIDMIESKFGTPIWEENQFASYDNGLSAVYIPLIKENKITAFILSVPNGNRFKSVIFEILSSNNRFDEQFCGEMNYYSLNGTKLASLSFEDGQYISLKSIGSKIVRLKSAQAEEDSCDWSCFSNCLGYVLTNSPELFYFCNVVCVLSELGVPLLLCAACLGAPALHCVLECCVSGVQY